MFRTVEISLVAVLMLASYSSENERNEGLVVGRSAPPLRLEKLLQAPKGISFERERIGSVIVLHFWAAWSAACVEVIPHLNDLADQFRDKPVRFVAVTDEFESSIEEFLKKHPISTWVAIDRDRSAFSVFGVREIPYTVVIDANGKIAGITRPRVLTASHLDSILNGDVVDFPRHGKGKIPSPSPAPETTIPSLGRLRLIGKEDSHCALRLFRPDAVRVTLGYEEGIATDKRVTYPLGHALWGRIHPLADQKTLQKATELFPTMVALAKGEEQRVSKSVLTLFEHYPSDRYRVWVKEEPDRFHLPISNGLFLKGYIFKPNARFPCVVYWGLEGTDGVGDDFIYCGEWILDKFCQSLPLEIGPHTVFRVKRGDVIEFQGSKILIEYIDHDNDTDPTNNSLVMRILGLDDLSRVKEAYYAGKSVTPGEFVKTACWNANAKSDEIEPRVDLLTKEDFKRQISAFTTCKTNKERVTVVRNLLLDSGYEKDELKSAPNGHGDSRGVPGDSEDIWVVKRGSSREAVIVAAHYDKTGTDSQGVIDDASGVVIVASVAKHLRTINSRLTYVFLFFGAEEVGHNWEFWLTKASKLQDPIKYVVNVEGGRLVGAKPTFRLCHRSIRGWLNWRFPVLHINETGGPQDYLKHTVKDNVSVCDFTRLAQSRDSLFKIMLVIDNLSIPKTCKPSQFCLD